MEKLQHELEKENARTELERETELHQSQLGSFSFIDVHSQRHLSVTRSPHLIGYYTDYVQVPHVVAMVGLPGRGKTYISKKLCRYLSWIGLKTKVFNLGSYRRMKGQYTDHNIFKMGNKEGAALRDRCALEALKDTDLWFELGGEVAIIDATNTTRERRQMLLQQSSEKGFKLFFIESICTDSNIIDQNIKEVKVNSPDYKDKRTSEIVRDFTERIQHYEEQYVSLDENEESSASFIKIINTGESVEIYNHEGPIQSRIIYYLMCLHILPRDIYFTRHGETEYTVLKRIGGNPSLSENGKRFASTLTRVIDGMNIPGLQVWTSYCRRTIETAAHFACPQKRWKPLGDLDYGICDGMTYDEVNKRYPNVNKMRKVNKFHYRFPKGESYHDLILRMEPVIMDLERESNVLVITHKTVLRCLLDTS